MQKLMLFTKDLVNLHIYQFFWINTADFRVLQPDSGYQAFLNEDERIHASFCCRSSEVI